MRITEIQRTSNFSFSSSNYKSVHIAAGTAAQQLDATFSTSAKLELYKLDYDAGSVLEPCCSITSDSRFYKVLFGRHHNGVIAGGCDNGCIVVWNAEKLLQRDHDTSDTLKFTKHTGPVRSLDWNKHHANLLASGAGDSQLLVWDLNKPSADPVVPDNKNSQAGVDEDILDVSWNHQVQHILASVSNSRCIIWDLRKNDPIIRLSESLSRMKFGSLCWHPGVATQLCVSSEEDKTPVIQLWDLRHATSPIRTLEGHSKGVLSMDWCLADADLLLSCGKDNRVLVSSPSTGEVVAELGTHGSQWTFDCQWCPKDPNIVGVASFDGKISLYSLLGSQSAPESGTSASKASEPASPIVNDDDPFAQISQQQRVSISSVSSLGAGIGYPPIRPPVWFAKHGAARFGFGGKLVSVCASKVNEEAPVQYSIHINQVVTEPAFVERAAFLQSAIRNKQLVEFCDEKIVLAADDEQQSMMWHFIKANLSTQPRQEFLTLLGFSPESISGDILSVTTDDRTNSGASDSHASGSAEETAVSEFDKLSFDSHAEKEVKLKEQLLPLTLSTSDNASPNSLLCRALLTGQFSAAVNLCIAERKFAEALLIGVAGGPELFQLAKKEFIKSDSSNANFRLLSAIVDKNFESVVESSSLESWQEVLCLLLAYTKPSEFRPLAELLARRLEASGEKEFLVAACFVLITAGNLDKLVSCWLKCAGEANNAHQLQDTLEIIEILRYSYEQVSQQSVPMCQSALDPLCNYAYALAAEGSLHYALDYLSVSQWVAGDSDQHEREVLIDRVYRALGSNTPAGMPAPKFPFKRRTIPSNSNQIQANQRRRTHSSGHDIIRHENLQQHLGVTRKPSGQGGAVAHPGYQMRPAPNVAAQATATQQPGYGQSLYNPSQVQYAAGGVGSAPPGFSQHQPQPIQQQPFQPQMVPSVPNYGVPTSVPAASYAPSQPSMPGYSSSVAPPQMHGYSTSGQQDSGRALARGPLAKLHAPEQTTDATTDSTCTSQPSAAIPFNPYPAMRVQPPGFPVQSTQSQAPAPTAMTSQYQTQYQSAQNVGPWNDPPSATVRKPQTAFVAPRPITTPVISETTPQQTPLFTKPEKGGISQAETNKMIISQPAAESKPDLPVEHVVVQKTFSALLSECQHVATNPHMKRKLEDCGKKLDSLYDSLRYNKLSQNVLSGLHNMVQCVQARDYSSVLSIHTQMVSTLNFAEISAFMPSLKVLVQSAAHLNVFIGVG